MYDIGPKLELGKFSGGRGDMKVRDDTFPAIFIQMAYVPEKSQLLLISGGFAP